jgi:hypothetical protein
VFGTSLPTSLKIYCISIQSDRTVTLPLFTISYKITHMTVTL